MYSKEHIQYLWEQYISDKASKTEIRQLFDYIKIVENDPENQEISLKIIESHPTGLPSSKEEELSEQWQSIVTLRDKSIPSAVSKFHKKINKITVHRVHFLRKWGWAAAVIMVLGSAAYFWTTLKKTDQTLASGNNHLQTDIHPGRNIAILTLADGQQIILDSTQGNIVKQGRLTVINLAGKLKYEGVGADAEYNTISTPKGGQYQIVLSDNSKVWLNAASSIKFPTAFTGNTREIEMTGEAYMEVARNPKQSFNIKANGVEIQVLGTSFNINAYTDESAIKTTLLEGSIKVISGGSSPISNKSNQTSSAVVVSSNHQPNSSKTDEKPSAWFAILKPGQQAQVTQQKLSVVNNADIAQALAWKNGVFQLGHTSLAATMRQLARWYDIEIVYEKGVPDVKLFGEIERNLTLSQVLDGLGQLGIKSRMDGRKLIVKQ